MTKLLFVSAVVMIMSYAGISAAQSVSSNIQAHTAQTQAMAALVLAD